MKELLAHWLGLDCALIEEIEREEELIKANADLHERLAEMTRKIAEFSKDAIEVSNQKEQRIMDLTKELAETKRKTALQIGAYKAHNARLRKRLAGTKESVDESVELCG